MPQKALFTKAPLTSIQFSPLSGGQIRTDDDKLQKLYQWIQTFIEDPVAWESAFGLACLLCDKPSEEPAARKIRDSLSWTESRMMEFPFYQQIQIVRSWLCFFEYRPDKTILNHIAAWIHMLEIQWEALIQEKKIRIEAADLLDLLLRFYRISGLHAVLRLCTRLRSAAMDWPSVLQHFRQRYPLYQMNAELNPERFTEGCSMDDTDYFTRQYLVNQAELLADGMRFTVYMSLFTGSVTEQNVVRNVWDSLLRDHGAVCGGTTADRLLAGNQTNRGVYAGAVAAWVEAFAAKAAADGSTWAVEALTRLVWNALPATISDNGIVSFQRVNCLTQDPGSFGCHDTARIPAEEEEKHLISRLARAYVTAYRSAVMPMASGDAAVLLTLAGTYGFSCASEPVHLKMSNSGICEVTAGVGINLHLYIAGSETRNVYIRTDKDIESCVTRPERPMEMSNDEAGQFVMIPINKPRNTIILKEGGIRMLKAHHQGVCFVVANQLQCMQASTDRKYAFAATGAYEISGTRLSVTLAPISKWKQSNGIPADIPVRPIPSEDSRICAVLSPYSCTPARIALFPLVRR